MPTSTLNTKTLAATSFRDRTYAFIAILDSNGIINGNYWDPGPYEWMNAKPLDMVDTFSTTFSAVALTSDSWLYGMTSDGKLLGFEMDKDDPYTFYCRGENIQPDVECM